MKTANVVMSCVHSGTILNGRDGGTKYGSLAWMGGVSAPSLASIENQNARTNPYIRRRNIALCQAAVAEAIEIFGRLDMLFCCDSEGGLNRLERYSWECLL